jgi:hypothetical protein
MYRPFKTVEEVETVFGKTIRGMNTPGISAMITGAMIYETGEVSVCIGCNAKLSADFLFRQYIFSDCSPCGVLV